MLSINKNAKVVEHKQNVELADNNKIEMIPTPGHCEEHYVFLLNGNILFTGDLLLGGSSTLVENLQ